MRECGNSTELTSEELFHICILEPWKPKQWLRRVRQAFLELHTEQFYLMMWFRRVFAVATVIPAVLSSAPPFIPQRPSVEAAPYDTGHAQPCSPPRDKGRYCFVQPSCGDDEDDAPHILKAFHECNDGGTVVLDQVYRIGSPLDLRFLRHIDVAITGEIHFDDRNVYYWAENSFKYDFQNQSTFWKWGGEDVNIYGDLSNDKSVIDGHGQSYWEEIQTNKTVSWVSSAG